MRQVATNIARRLMKSTNKLFILALTATSLSLFGCGNLPEASFELANKSRLPKWFVLPPGLSRADVTVSMSYYIKASERIATFTLFNARKEKLAEAKGVLKGLEPLQLRNPPSGFPTGYPSYEIVTVNGITEIIEHRRMEPVFYITDDPAVWSELGLSQDKKPGATDKLKR